MGDRADEVGAAITEFLVRVSSPAGLDSVTPPEGEGTVAEITYRVQGSGPPR